ncbi:MAG: NADH:ubiquinone reductase (Na(+)-transporting) subunit D, partial [Pirellulales bacterium]|nr:NADH:ubiquinone reductase (Na(+)-transporting) subunit D [Pirellulales bacterium]
MSVKKVLFGPILSENPITVQVLGICSALAITTKLETAVTMCIAVTFVTAFSNLAVSLIRNITPSSIRMIVEMT